MDRPTLVYDDDCGFCTWWAEFFERHGDVRTVGFSEIDDKLLDVLPDDYRECSHLITESGIYSCGASLEEGLAHTCAGSLVRPLVSKLRQLKGYRRLRERAYRSVAGRRAIWGRFLSRRVDRGGGEEE